jgi:hypothetical protein
MHQQDESSVKPVPGKLAERCEQCRAAGGHHIVHQRHIYSASEQGHQLLEVRSILAVHPVSSKALHPYCRYASTIRVCLDVTI